MHTKVRWPLEDRIRWVEWRVQERITAAKQKESGQLNEFDPDPEHELDTASVPDRLSLEVWLAKERDGQSWQQIVIKQLPQYAKGKHITAGMSKARRMHASVEKALEPPRKDALRRHLDGCIWELFHCTPQDFKRYLDSINLRKAR
jgi:hypothetical protein